MRPRGELFAGLACLAAHRGEPRPILSLPPAAADVQLGRWLGQGRRTREIGDYDDFLAIDEDEATEAVARAARFLDEARRWLPGRGEI